MTKYEGIGKIKYGEIHLYYPFEINTKLAFEEICETIENSSVIFNDNYKSKIENALTQEFTPIVEDLGERLKQEFNLEITPSELTPIENKIDSSYKIESSDIIVELSDDDCDSNTLFSITLKYAEIEELKIRLKRQEDEIQKSKEIYGDCFIESQKQFLFLPFKITLNNGKIVWLNAILYIFKNNMGILKLELPLVDIDTVPFKENNINLFIKKIENKWSTPIENNYSKISEVVSFYLSALGDTLGITCKKTDNGFKHIILVDFDGIPKQMGTLPNAIQEDLYKIICAPVQERKNVSYLKDAKEYISINSYGTHDIRYILKTTGGCLSLVDLGLLNCIANDYFYPQTEFSSLNDADYYYACNCMARNLSVNAELALIIILLKKLNENTDFLQKESSSQELYKIRNRYNYNTIFISKLQEDCYGSVSEQISFFESRMPYYLKTEIANSKRTAIDNILEEEKEQNTNKLQNFLTWGGFIFTVFFGLPSIYDTLKIIRNISCIVNGIPHDIPKITLEMVSLFLWLILNLYIGYRIFLKKKH